MIVQCFFLFYFILFYFLFFQYLILNTNIQEYCFFYNIVFDVNINEIQAIIFCMTSTQNQFEPQYWVNRKGTPMCYLQHIYAKPQIAYQTRCAC